ncbi:MAG: DUF3592 domain-containing protein [Clostridia bacterium]|nr:hypothetical protein [Clostridiales bacterium]MCR5803276.1 DUF3592 domain-containing protein [Clostridia bacterium]
MLDKLDFLNNLSDDERKLFTGIGLVVLGVFAMFILSQLLMIPGRLQARARYKNYTGRALGKITNRNMISVQRGHDDEGRPEYTTKCMVSYEFTVGGVLYKGEGEGSGAGRDKYEAEICYDPSDPDQNCTAYYFNSKTKSHFISTFIYLAVFFAVIMIGIYFFMRFKQ